MNSITIATETEISFLQKLRSKTSASHSRLELLPISAAIISPKITPKEYAAYVSLMYAIVRDTEEFVFPKVAQIITDIDSRCKLSHLNSDSEAIQFPVHKAKTSLAQQWEIPFALGILYVVEGSSLGGRVILQNITKTLGYTEENGARYFSGYGNTTGSQWKKFLDMLSDYERDYGQSDQIIAGATFAFDTIYEHLATFSHAD